jgi:hypothetical protein
MTGSARELDLGWHPMFESALTIIHREEGRFAFVVLFVHPSSHDAPGDQWDTPAILHANGVEQCVSGYPNNEAWEKDPRLREEIGICEILDSGWLASLSNYNEATYGRRIEGSWGYDIGGLHHFFIGSHEGSVQILAREISLEVFPDESHAWCEREALRRQSQEFERWRYTPAD